jgi:hypothetical protein
MSGDLIHVKSDLIHVTFHLLVRHDLLFFGWLRGHRRDPVNASERWYTVRLEHQQGCAPQVDVSQSTRDVIPVLSACTSVDASKDVVLHDLGVVLVSQQRLEPILLERWADSVLVGVGHDGAREGEHGRGYEHE